MGCLLALLIGRGPGSGSIDPEQNMGKTGCLVKTQRNALDEMSSLDRLVSRGEHFDNPKYFLFLKCLVFISVTECLKGTVLETLSMGSPQWCTDFSHGLDR